MRTGDSMDKTLTTVLGLGLLAAGCAEVDAEPQRAQDQPSRAIDPISVAVAQATRGEMVSLYSTSATLRAEKLATVTSRTRGVLEELLVEEGDTVEAGRTIAKLEDEEQILAVGRYETTREIKRRELERSTELLESNIISENELALLRREAEEARHDLELARLELARTTILAPFDGIVVRRHLDVGATVSDGTPIYDLADIDPLYADVNVPERHVARLARDQTVRLSADTLPSRVEAKIERIAPIVDAATGTVKVTVAVEPSVQLRPGAFVEVDVVTDVHRDALVVPRAALVAEGRRWLVFLVNEGGETVQAIEVELGFEEDDRIEILRTVGEARLQAGDTVVVLGASALSDGAAIRILERDEPDGKSAENARGADVESEDSAEKVARIGEQA